VLTSSTGQDCRTTSRSGVDTPLTVEGYAEVLDRFFELFD
jgi:hypothetical protein